MLHTVLKRSRSSPQGVSGGIVQLTRRGVSFSPSNYPSSFSTTGYVPKPINIGFVICPQQSAFVIERFGKFSGVLEAGIHPLIPLADRVAYAHSLKEQALSIPSQSAITKDNVTISIDGVLYIRVMDPYAASYGVSDPIWAVTQLAQTTMRSELGKYSLDRTFAERDALNSAIVATINSAATTWGISCLRYEIRDITPPASLAQAMSLQAEAERRKRADILESEGKREASINAAEGQRRSTVLAAQGEAEATLARAHSSAAAVEMLAVATSRKGADKALALRVAEQYVSAFGNIARKGNMVVLPADTGNVGGMVGAALGVFAQVAQKGVGGGTGGGEEGGEGGEVKDTTQLYNDAIRHLREAETKAVWGGGGGGRNPSPASIGGGGGRAQDSPISISSEEAANRVVEVQGGSKVVSEEGSGEGAKFTPSPYPKN